MVEATVGVLRARHVGIVRPGRGVPFAGVPPPAEMLP